MPSVGQWLASINPSLRLEGELLLADHLALSRTKIIAFPETEIDALIAAKLEADMARISQGEPLAYILGSREFWGLDLTVSADVLVPRPETELLVEYIAATAQHHARVLELGTGSGAIAIALAHERGDLDITATDVSASALEIAMHNAKRHNQSVRFLQSDWFEGISDCFDVVVSNPPYIAENDPHLPQLVHEPQLALVAANDGLDCLHHIILQAKQHLSEDGLLMLEHGYDQGDAMVEAFESAGYTNIIAHKDLAQHHRATSAHVSV